MKVTYLRHSFRILCVAPNERWIALIRHVNFDFLEIECRYWRLSGYLMRKGRLCNVASCGRDVKLTQNVNFADTSSLPFTMRDSEIAIRDVRIVVRHSKLPSRAELENELAEMWTAKEEAERERDQVSTSVRFVAIIH